MAKQDRAKLDIISRAVREAQARTNARAVEKTALLGDFDPRTLMGYFESPNKADRDFTNVIDGSLVATHIAPTALGDGRNLLANPSFETGQGYFGTDGWNLSQSGGGNPGYESATLQPGVWGDRALVMGWNTHSGPAEQGGSYTASTIVENGIVGGALGGWQQNIWYVISFFVRIQSGSATGPFVVWDTAPSDSVQLLWPALSSSWQRYALKVRWTTTPQINGKLNIQFSSQLAFVLLDAVMVEQSAVLDPFASAGSTGITAGAISDDLKDEWLLYEASPPFNCTHSVSYNADGTIADETWTATASGRQRRNVAYYYNADGTLNACVISVYKRDTGLSISTKLTTQFTYTAGKVTSSVVTRAIA